MCLFLGHQPSHACILVDRYCWNTVRGFGLKFGVDYHCKINVTRFKVSSLVLLNFVEQFYFTASNIQRFSKTCIMLLILSKH